ncbi:Capsule biosynthesis protein CapA [Nocardioides aquaticus]|uniref:Capsule biosynthesis protein CapA n=4 Tax=Nocardioides aquaticus TaxID=160826 RepID=A0ABX8EGE3_9ACTN|nr:CapA family protein [Nocardioides aquaticus]QVT79391.1 Capsule biosynthesis protein CapA [Nocardioides aquaticus]
MATTCCTPRRTGFLGALLASLVLTAACSVDGTRTQAGPEADDGPRAGGGAGVGAAEAPGATLTLAFAGDVHFEQALGDLVQQPGSDLGPVSRVLGAADVAMVNLESALASRDTPTDKELEDPDQRYWFRSDPAALGVLARSGVDVVSLANNHGADHGRTGLQESLAVADERARPAVVGIGAGAAQAHAPYRVDVRGTGVAVLAADASPRESRDPVWAAGEGGPGIAAARSGDAGLLLDAVRRAARTDDVVAVYLHWGEEERQTPTAAQRGLAERLARAGADVVVGSHAHVLLGSGMLDDTYVGYGLGNFTWYHGRKSETGVLTLELRDGVVVGDRWSPARIPLEGGVPRPLAGRERDEAQVWWRDLRRGTGLAPTATATPVRLPAYRARVAPIGEALGRRMTGSSHDPATCPLPLDRLRVLSVPHVGFDGQPRTGRMVVRASLARDVVQVFERLYDARWPLRRMRLVDAFGGDDDRSMAADNSSGYNCREVAGSDTLSAHAFGRAIDVNPVENPYLTAGGVLPPAGARFADLDRTADAQPPAGVVHADDVVVRAFAEVGWEWGGDFSAPDYQHFYRP